MTILSWIAWIGAVCAAFWIGLELGRSEVYTVTAVKPKDDLPGSQEVYFNKTLTNIQVGDKVTVRRVR